MGSLVYTLVSMVQVASLHCSMRPEISPCSCAPHESYNNTIHVTCEGLNSFNQVFDSLQNKFSNTDNIWLKITKSSLDDLETRNFKDMNMNITKLFLNYDDLRTLPESSFRNLSNLGYFSLSDNKLEEIPRHIFAHMPKIVTMDLGHGRIKTILTDDFRSLNEIRYLILVNNNIRFIEKKSMPKTLRFLHLGRNNLTSLNGTLRDIENLDVLFLNENNLTTLDGELPIKSANFKSLIAHHNKLENLTQDLAKFMYLDAMYVSDNEIKSLGNVFQNASYIQTLSAHNNKIEYLATNEFSNAIELQELDLANNFIRAINNSLLPLKRMRICNMSRNHLVEFSLNEVRGLTELQVVDLSYNHIEKLTGRMENVVEQDLYFVELRLDHNLLKSLDGAMLNLNRLKILDISFNKMKTILPDDLIGLDDLESLDISHNYLQSLEEASMTFLPKLEKLYCSYNNLTKLERDFYGLPTLCFADLSNNHITYISPELVTKTRCNSHGVINKLEILLQENPILCMDELSKLFAQMEEQETRLLGIAHCIVPKEEEVPIIEEVPVFVPPPPQPSTSTPQPQLQPQQLPQLLLTASELKENLSSDSQSNLVQDSSIPTERATKKPTIEEIDSNTVITADTVPSVILTSITNTVTAPTIAETLDKDIEIIVTTQISIPNPAENNDVDIVMSVQAVKTESTQNVLSTVPTMVSATVTTATSPMPIVQNENENTNNESSQSEIQKLENATVLNENPPPPTSTMASIHATQTMKNDVQITSSPTSLSSSASASSTAQPSSIAEIILGEMESVSKNPEPENYIYETFSPISPVEVSPIQRNEHIVLAEEPPEIPNDAVPAA